MSLTRAQKTQLEKWFSGQIGGDLAHSLVVQLSSMDPKNFVEKSDFNSFADRIHEQFTQLNDRLDRDFGKIDQRFEQVDQRFEQVDQRFEQVDQRFEQVDQKFVRVEQRLGQMEERMDGADHRFESLEVQIRGFGGRIGLLENRFDQFERSLYRTQDEVHKLRYSTTAALIAISFSSWILALTTGRFGT